MADEPKTTLSTAAPKPVETAPAPKKTWMGLDPDKVPESIRPLIQLYADTSHKFKEQRGVANQFNIPQVPKPTIDKSAALELQRLKNAMPDTQARIALNKSLSETHGMFSAFSGPRMWGKSMLQEKDERLQNMVERYGNPPNATNAEEAKEQRLKSLIDSVRNQDEYDGTNPLFDSEEEGKLSKNATEILNIWSMQNLNTKFDSPEDLYENFGAHYDKYQKIKEDYDRVLLKTAQQEPKEIRNIVVKGKIVGAVPKFGEMIDGHLSEGTNNQLAREVFGDKTSKGLYDLYYQGMQEASQMSDDKLKKVLRSDTAFNQVRQNAFSADKDALPSETYIPMDMTPDGRFAINKGLLTDGVYLAKYRILEAKNPNMEPDEIHRRALNQTRMLTNALLDENRLMVHRDPEGALRDYLEGRGFAAGAYNLASFVTGAKTAGALGFDLPDRVAKAAFALALPRRAAGVITQAGEETGFVREGEFFSPYLGDNLATNSADHLLRIMGFFDEPLTRSFTLAVDDEARERHEDDAGRPMRVLAKMAENFGSDRHIEFMTSDVNAGGRFLAEFGEVFYEPVLKSAGINAPTTAAVGGALTALGVFLLAPSPFEAVSTGIALGKAGAKAATGTKFIGLSNQRLMGRGSEGMVDTLNMATDNARQVTNQEELAKVDEIVYRAVKEDQTGVMGAIALLANAGSLMEHGVSGAIKSKSMKRLTEMYGTFKDKRSEHIKKAEAYARRAEKYTNEAKQADLKLKEAEQLALAAKADLEAEQVIAESLTMLAQADDVERHLIGQLKLKGVQGSADAEFLGDAFALLRGEEFPRLARRVPDDDAGGQLGMFKKADDAEAQGPALSVDLFVKKYGKTQLFYPYGKGMELSTDPALRMQQVRSLISQRLVKMMDESPSLKSLPDVERFANHIKNSAKGVFNVAKQIDAINEKLAAYTKVVKTLKVDNLAPKHVIEALEAQIKEQLGNLGRMQDSVRQKEQYLEDLAARKRKLRSMTDEEMDAFIIDEYNQYLDRLYMFAEEAGKVADLPPKVFDGLKEVSRGLERRGLAQGLVEAESGPIKKLVDNMATGDIEVDAANIGDLASASITTNQLVDMIRDPMGLVNLEIRTKLRHGPLEIFTDPRAWAIKVGLWADKVYRGFPIFTTNVRYLNATVRREFDDIAKGTSREARNILDSFNQIFENIEDPAEAEKLVRGILTSTNDITEIDSKFTFFGTSQKITITAAAGRSTTMAQAYLKRIEGVFKAKAKVRGEELGTNVSLDASLKAFMDDASVSIDNIDQIMTSARQYAVDEFGKIMDAGKPITVEMIEEILRKAVKQSGAVVVDATGPAAMRSRTLMYKAIVLGAMEHDFIGRVINVIGPRFNGKMARAMNYLMGQGRKEAALSVDTTIVKDDFVVLRVDNQANASLMNKMHDIDNVRHVDDLSLDKEIYEGMAPQFTERPVDPNFVATKDGPVPADTTFESFADALADPNKFEDAKKMAYGRAPKLEQKIAELSGESAMKVLKFNEEDPSMVHLVICDTGEEVIHKLDDLVHRDISLSVLDAMDGFNMLGMQMATNLGMTHLTDKMRDLRVGYQKMVAVGLDENGLQFLPQAMISDLVNQISDIEKDFGDLMSVKEVERANLADYIRNTVLTGLRWWKTHILTGLLVPRPAYFMNQLFGDFSQMFITMGTGSAGLAFMGGLAYFPVFGKSLQDGYFDMMSKLPPGKVPLPGMFSSMFNASMTKILNGSDEILELPDGTKMTYGQFKREAIRAGILDNIISEDMMQSSVRSIRNAQRGNPTLFRKLSDAGFGFTYMQKMMGHKINNVQTRQRLLLYAHGRINKGLSETNARKLLHESMFDWTHSVGRQEMDYMGRYLLFYTLSKNAMALTFGSFFELSNIGTKAYLKKYMFGKTRLQRLELVTRFMTQFEERPSPFEELTPEEQQMYAALQFQPDYFAEYPFLSFGAISPEGQQLMLDKGSFLRTMYGRSLPKATAVEYLINLTDIVGSISALAVSMGTIVDPDGNVIPISVNRNKALEQGLDAMVDQYFVPMYADVIQDWAQEMLGLRDIPASEYGARVKPTDMPTIQLLQAMGLGSLVTLTDDPNEPGQQRVAYALDPVSSPFVNIAKTEVHRASMILGLAFPGMSPVEIQALATSKEGMSSMRARLEALGNIMNVGKAIFYNGANERYYKLDAVADRFSVLENTLERYAETAIEPEK